MDELDRLIQLRRETLGVELKGPLPWSEAATRGKVLKAALAMANRRDGGVLLLGLSRGSDADRYELNGLDPAEAANYGTDAVAAFVNAYADPHIDLTVEKRVVETHHLIAVVVREFREVPVMSTKDYVVDGRPVVRGGRLYCRSHRMIESTEVQSVEDLRAIIDLATEKGLEHYFRLRSIERASVGPEDAAAFERQLGGL